MDQISQDIVVAVIDLGSNSLRLQVSQVLNGTYKVIDDYKEIARLGDVVYSTGKFSDQAVDVLINTLKRMQVIIERHNASKIRVVGTALFRDASNTDDVLSKVKAETGFVIDIIPGEEEARFSYLAATANMDIVFTDALFVDIGGGSTELSFVIDGRLVETISIPLGCSRLTQKFMNKDGSNHSKIKELKKYIEDVLESVTKDYVVDKAVFTGGTVNMLAQVATKRSSENSSQVNMVEADFIEHFIPEISRKSVEEIKKIQGIEPDRADITLAAALVVRHILRKYRLKFLLTFTGGLRNGVTIDMLNKMGIKLFYQMDSDKELRYSKLIETGRKYKFDEAHALQVTKISKMLFEQLKNMLGLQDSDWRLLEAAALLHDIGQYIGFQDHNKHSQYLIMNSDMVGYEEDEVVIIGNVARYHRKGAPKNKHEGFNSLSNKEKNIVKKLSAILRMADGADRSHQSAITAIDVIIKSKTIVFMLYTTTEYEVDFDGINKKKDLFEELTGKELVLQSIKENL